MKSYGIYIGFDFISVAVRNIETPIIMPLLIYPLHRTMERRTEVCAAFDRIVAEKVISVDKSCVAVLAFESSEDMLFITQTAPETPDINEMMSWELFMRTQEAVKDYNISAFNIEKNKYIVAASKNRDIDFFTKQVKRLGLKTVTIEPPLVSVINLFEMNYDVAGENLIALIGCHKIIIAYIRDGKLIDIAQNTLHLSELISSEYIMKTRAEISQRNNIYKEVQMYIAGDLLADKEYSDYILSDMINCRYLDSFKTISLHDDTDKELMEKYSPAFGVAVSLSNKMV